VAFRRSEWVLIAYFLYVILLARVLPARPPVPNLILALNLTVIAGYALLAYADSLRRRRPLSVIRDWFALPLILLAYREMGWLAPARHTYQLEQVWVQWDKYFLNTMGAKSLIEFLGPVIPSLLDISYTLVYAVPYFALGMLYAYGRSDRVDRFLFPFALAVLSSFALFPFFPSEPPRTVFPGQDFPTWMTFFRQFNWGMLESYGIHTSVFPSGHVSGAFSAAFALRAALPEKRWTWRVLITMAVMIATASVYGRYHYLADAAAGFAMSLAAIAVCGLLPASVPEVRSWREQAWIRPPASERRSSRP
jgi:membrane-associated phospholipid phosphatase